MQKLHNSGFMKFMRKQLRNNMTHAEVLLWMRLKSSALGYKFRRQHSIGTSVVDFYCPSAKLVIELDGAIHQDEFVQRNDRMRQKLIEQLGFKVIRFTNDEIFANVEGVLRRIRADLSLSEGEKAREGACSSTPSP